MRLFMSRSVSISRVHADAAVPDCVGDDGAERCITISSTMPNTIPTCIVSRSGVAAEPVVMRMRLSVTQSTTGVGSSSRTVTVGPAGGALRLGEALAGELHLVQGVLHARRHEAPPDHHEYRGCGGNGQSNGVVHSASHGRDAKKAAITTIGGANHNRL